MFDTLAGLFGGSGAGASKAANKYLDQANQNINNFGQQYQNMLSPWVNSGQNALGNYQDAIMSMSNPQDFINNLTSQYSISPFAKYQMNQGIKAANAAGAASGMLGSGAEQEALQRMGNDIIGQDEQRYLNNLMGVWGQYTGGLNNLQGQGLGAQQSVGQMLAQLLGMQNNNYNQMGANAGSGYSSGMQGISNMLGGGLGMASDLLGWL